MGYYGNGSVSCGSTGEPPADFHDTIRQRVAGVAAS